MTFAAVGIAGGALIAGGIAAKGVAGAKAAKGAKYLDQLRGEIPQAQRSQYVPQMIGTAQQALNANPLAAAMQRRNQGMTANSLFQARMSSSDPSTLLAMNAAMQGKAAENDLGAQIGDEQLKEARRSAYYNALQAGMQDENNYFDQRMANIQARGGLATNAAQTRAATWNSIGGGLMSIGGSMLGAGMEHNFGQTLPTTNPSTPVKKV